MTVPVIIATVLVLAVLLGIAGARRRRQPWSAPTVWLQPLGALAFYALLFPPSIHLDAGSLTVLTAGAKPGLRMVLSVQPAVALPGAPTPAGVESTPDLATALRRYPQTRSLVVLGDGLAERDRDAVGTLGLRFEPVSEHGLLELNLPPPVPLGTQWALRGRVAPGATQVELHDPSGAIVDATRPDAAGRFALSGPARALGPARFQLRLLDAQSRPIETASVPIVAQGGEGLRVILRVGAPDAEFKYWRRWASDAGIALRLRAGLSEKVDLRDGGDITLTPDGLAQTDLVIIDERAWSTLDAGEKAALKAAVDQGLGLLLKLGGPVDAAVAADWAAFGLSLSAVDRHGVTLDRRTGLRDRAAFTVAPAGIELVDGIPLLQADDGELLAAWRREGRGRVAVWRLLDSYRLSLLGEPARYGALWSPLLSTLARPQPASRTLPSPPVGWIDERAALCGLGAAAMLVAPDATRLDMHIGPDRCAAIWPAQSGWYRIVSDGLSSAFYVRAADDAVSLRAARDRRDTRRRQAATPAAVNAPGLRATLPRWPFFALWLAIAALQWWRERPGLG